MIFNDEEQAYDIFTIEEVLNRYILLAFCSLLCILVYWIVYSGFFSYGFVFLPMVGLEVKFIVESGKRVREEYEIILSLWKNESFMDVFESLGSILTYFLIICYIENILQNACITAVPLILLSLLKIVVKVSTANNCVSFNSIV